jgi:GxxExxY protein
MDSEATSKAIIGAAMRVHSALGPGLLESTYRACLAHELHLAGLRVLSEWPVSISYRGVRIDVGYRMDLVVEDCVVAELKAVEKLLRLHDAQLIAYLKLGGMNVGLLINFCVPQLRLGIRRLVHNYHEE